MTEAQFARILKRAIKKSAWAWEGYEPSPNPSNLLGIDTPDGALSLNEMRALAARYARDDATTR